MVGLYGQANLLWLAIAVSVLHRPRAAHRQRSDAEPFEFLSVHVLYVPGSHEQRRLRRLRPGPGQARRRRFGLARRPLDGNESHNDVTLWDYGGSPFGTPYEDLETQKSSAFTYKAAVDWAINDGDFLYGFVATGYTGGGLNTFTSTTGGPAPFNAVTDTDYELGWKRNSWFDGHLRTEVDAFYTDYNHFQVTLSDPAVPLNTYEINLPATTTIYGAEAEAQASFGQFSFTGTIGLLKSFIGNFWADRSEHTTCSRRYVRCVGRRGGHRLLLRQPEGASDNLCSELHV